MVLEAGEAYNNEGKRYCRSGTGKELHLSHLNVGNHLYIKNQVCLVLDLKMVLVLNVYE